MAKNKISISDQKLKNKINFGNQEIPNLRKIKM